MDLQKAKSGAYVQQNATLHFGDFSLMHFIYILCNNFIFLHHVIYTTRERGVLNEFLSIFLDIRL